MDRETGLSSKLGRGGDQSAACGGRGGTAQIRVRAGLNGIPSAAPGVEAAGGVGPLLAYTKFTFKEFRVCVRAIFAFAGGYKLGERYLLGELERRLLPLRLAPRPLRQALRYP